MVFYNGRIFTQEGKVIEDGYIKTENKKIISIGKSCEIDINKENEKYNLNKMDIYPGFIDSHCHMGMFGISGYENSDISDNINPVTPQYEVKHSINLNDEIFKESCMSGVTTAVISPGSESIVSGDIIALKTCYSDIDKAYVKEKVGIKFSLGENPKSQSKFNKKFPKTRMGIVSLIKENLDKAKYSEQNNVNDKSDKKTNILKRVINKELKAFFHCHTENDIISAIDITNEFNLDSVLIHATDAHFIKDKIKDVNIILGPYLTDKSKEELKNLSIKSPKELESCGTTFSICSDYPENLPQYLNITAAIAIKNGLTRDKALRAITIDAAKICGIDEKVGSLKVDKDCDFIGFSKDEDIFSPYSSPKLVVVDGQIIKKEV